MTSIQAASEREEVNLRELLEQGRAAWDMFDWSSWAPAPADILDGQPRPGFFELSPYQSRASVDLGIKAIAVLPLLLEVADAAREANQWGPTGSRLTDALSALDSHLSAASEREE